MKRLAVVVPLAVQRQRHARSPAATEAAAQAALAWPPEALKVGAPGGNRLTVGQCSPVPRQSVGSQRCDQSGSSRTSSRSSVKACCNCAESRSREYTR